MAYHIEMTSDFEKMFNKLSPDVQNRFQKQIVRLQSDPFAIGKILRGKKHIRELKQGVYRLYYIIDDVKVIVLLVSMSKKHDQKEMIDMVFALFKGLKRSSENLIKDSAYTRYMDKELELLEWERNLLQREAALELFLIEEQITNGGASNGKKKTKAKR